MLFFSGCDSDEDTDCQLSKVETSFGSVKQATYEIFYTNDKISAVRSTLHTQGNEQATYFLEWDGDRLASVFLESEGSAFEEYYYYTYAGDSSTVTYHRITGGDTTTTFSESVFYRPQAEDAIYSYQGTVYEFQGGNVVKTAPYTEDGDGIVVDENQSVHLEYDDRDNALGELLRLPNFLGLDNPEARINSKNNLIQATYTNGNNTRNYDFTYDNSGNLLNINDLSTGRLMAFSYECK
jgi:hypothetical protein